MASKSPDAFRTISEVADWLETPAHVLRFWESKFTQVKPVKRAGGRRYYRPADMQLLGGIKRLLHDDGMTIKGVQKLLREHGVRHVAALSPPLDTDGPVPPPAAATVLDFPTGGSTPEPAPSAPALRPEETPKTPAETTEDPVPRGDETPGDIAQPEGAEPVLEDVRAAGFGRDDALDSDIPETPPTGQAEVEAAPDHPVEADVDDAALAEKTAADAEEKTEPAPAQEPQAAPHIETEPEAAEADAETAEFPDVGDDATPDMTETEPRDTTAPKAPLPGFVQGELDRMRPSDPSDGGVLTAIVTRRTPVKDPAKREAIIAEAQKLAALRSRLAASRGTSDKK